MVISPLVLIRLRRAHARSQSALATLWAHRWSVLREVARGSAASLLILFPTLISSIDHHGIERMPLHLHFVSGGGPAPSHTHGFETPHHHGAEEATPPQAAVVETQWPAAEAALAPSSLMAIGVGITLLECALVAVWLASSRPRDPLDIVISSQRPDAAFLTTLTQPPR
jgi:hypothetical protein